MEKVCLDCGDTLRGRVDKKFCSDQCRNNYNNRMKIDSNTIVRKTNAILAKNRKIIMGLTPEDKATVHKAKLMDNGFNFNYFTSIYTNKKGQDYYFCYEYGYLPLENDFYMLVHRQAKSDTKKTATE
jgi:predicted nucleic acid-binding Zn ribbon protein